MTVARPSQRGFTLIETLIAVTLVAMLSTAMLFALRIGLNSEDKTEARIVRNRRALGAQRALESEINGFMPELAAFSGPQGGAVNVPFFEGAPDHMRFVSSYSLQGGWRATPQILEFAIIPGSEHQGLRIIVNERAWRGPASAGVFVAGVGPDETGTIRTSFVPIQAGEGSFVLADHLGLCRLLYLDRNQDVESWRDDWVKRTWPLAIRVELAPLASDAANLHPVTVTSRVRATRSPDVVYSEIMP